MKAPLRMLIFLIIVIYPVTLLAFQATEEIEQGWQYIAQNQIKEATSAFLQAIKKDENNPRPYLALSFIEQLSGNNEKSWEWYEKALKRLNDPNPYIFAAVLTARGQLSDTPDENRGIYRVFKQAIENGDKGGVLRAGTVEKYGKYYQQKGDFDKALEYYNQIECIDDWTLIGPFENISASGYAKEFPPEKEYNAAIEYAGKNGMPVKWFKVNKMRSDHWIDFIRYFAESQAVFYGNTFIYSDKKQPVQIRAGTSGSVKVFLNNQLIIANEDENNNDLDTYIAATELQKGWNRLLIKCGYSEINQCNFMVRVTSDDGRAIPGLKTDTKSHEYRIITDAPVKIIPNFAEEYFEGLLKTNPDQIENYLLLAECYLRNDKAPEAERVLLQAQEKMPESVLIKSQLLEAYIRGEKTDEMISTIAKIYSTYPEVPLVLQYKFQEYSKNENYDEAGKIADRLEKIQPESPDVMLMRMNLAFQKGDMEKGFSILANAYKKYPDKWEIVYLSALFSIRTTKKYDGAIEIYKKYIEHNHIDDAYIQLANTYLNASDVDMFEDTYLEFLEENPAATGIYYALAKVFLQIKNYTKAEKYIDECIGLCPGYSEYWSLLGDIQHGEGEKEKAINSYKTALRYDAKDYTSRDRIRELENKGPIFNYFVSNNIDSLINNAPEASAYPNDNAVYLLDNTQMVVYKNGANEKKMEVLIKVFNAEGIDAIKEYWLPVNGYSEKLIIDKAITRKADGTEIKADVDDNHLVFKSLEPNDFVYMQWHIQSFYKGRLSSHFWEEVNFNYFMPAKNVSFSLLINKKIPFQHKTQNMPDAPSIKKTPEGLLYTWSAKDQPAVEWEYDMPSLDDIGKMLFISSIPSWEYLVDWYKDLAETKTKVSYEIKEKVHDLLSKYPDASEMKKIELIYNYITENINYSSVSFRQSGLIPQPARKVLVQKIGDCKDVATLCIAMLKEAGIPAHYVLVNTFDEGQNKSILPSLEFNHAIVGVNTKRGTIYMDLTAKNYPFLTVPQNDINAFALSITPGTKKPFYLDKKFFTAGITKRRSTVQINDDNSVLVTRTTYRTGLPGASFRDLYRFKGHNQLITDLTESLSDDFPNVKVEQFDIPDVDKVNPEINYTYSFSVPFYITDAGNMKLIKLPWTDAAKTQRSLSYDKRKYAFEYRASTDTLSEEIDIKLPEGYTVLNMQKENKFGCDIAEYSLSMEVENGTLKARRRFINKKSIVKQDDYQKFKEFYNKAIRTDAQPIILQAVQ